MKLNNRLSVLYADDNEDARLMLETLLEFSGIDVVSAHTAEDAFQAAQDNHFDLYLLDNRFSDRNGLELCRRLKEFDPHTPIVFYSGDARKSDCQKGLAAGASAYLTKPHSNTIVPTIFKLVAMP